MGYLDCMYIYIYICHAFGLRPNGIQTLFLEPKIIDTEVNNSATSGFNYPGRLVDMVTIVRGLPVIRGLRLPWGSGFAACV